LKAELLEVIANGEGSGVEFKRDDILREQLAKEVLRDYGYVDARGMGIRTKVVPLTRALSGRDPEFEVTDDYLTTTLYRALPE